MNEKAFVKIIESILKNGGKIICSNHAIGRMAERKIRIADIEDILFNPTEIPKAEPSKSFPDRINYKVKGKYEWAVVVSLQDLHIDGEIKKIVVVTVID